MTCVHCGGQLDASRPDCPQCGRPRTDRAGDEVVIKAVRLDDVLAGRYRLEQKIGEGGMGTVYVAHDRELDRRVAVKILSASYVGDKEVVDRFEREARLTAQLDHPNIVPVYDVGRHDGRPFIVMKKLEGETLATVLRDRGGFSRDETLGLFRQLAAGLDYIHHRGFIHRDVKTGNIFLSPDGHAHILDFGILRTAQGNEPLTRTGMVMGTPHYMAPEQALGIRDVDYRVDLYALAVVLFECLSGTLPFEAESELQIIQLQAHAPPPDLRARAPWIPPGVAQVLARGLSKDPAQRYTSAVDLVQAVDEAWRGGPELAHVTPRSQPPAVNPTTSPSLRRLGSDSLPPIVVGETLAPPAPPSVTEPTPISTEEFETAVQKTRAPWVVAAILVLGVAAAVWGLVGGDGRADPLGTGGGAGSGAAGGLEGPMVVADAGDEADAGLLAEAPADAGEEEPDAGLALAVTDVPDAGEEVDAGASAVVRRPRTPGELKVITRHRGEPFWAQVSIDGVDRGRTPLALDLPQGNYKLRVERAGFRPQQRQIWVASGKSIVVRIDLTQ